MQSPELHPRGPSYQRSSENVATIMPQEPKPQEMEPKGMGEVEQKRVADLKRQLQEAERAAFISEVATRLHGIEPPAAAEKTWLGPVLT